MNQKNPITKLFIELSSKDVLLAGGKGASLGEMTQAGIPVPPGFVVLSTSFDRFLEETDLDVEIDSILHKVNHKEIHTVENASEEIKALILGVKMPEDIASEIKKEFKKLSSKYVAVRSSATAEDSSSAAWAGQLESYLNTTEKDLLQNVQKCWASLFTPRAIFYRFEKGLHGQKISVAVVVQKMVESEVSGIAFTVHPVTQDYNQLIIEAGLGLGEAIVSGQITPDSYVAEKQPRRIIDKNIQAQTRGLFRSDKGGNEWQDIPEDRGEKQVLSDDQILELSNIILNIERHYGFPCDIEWALENNKFYIVQSRPITTLTLTESNDSKQESKTIKDIIDFKNKNWVVYGAAGYPVFITPFTIVPSIDFTRIYGIPNEGVGLWRGKTLDWLYDGDQLNALVEKELPNLLDQGWKFYDNWTLIAKEFDILHESLMEKDLSVLDFTELKDLMVEYYDLFRKQYAANNIIEPLSYYFQNHINNMLIKAGIKKDRLDEIVGKYGLPARKSYLKLLAEEYTQNKENTANLVKKYHYVNNDYLGSKPVTSDDIKSIVKNISTHINNTGIDSGLPTQAKEILDIFQISVTIQDVRKGESLMWISGADKLLREYAKRTNFEYNELLFATWEELFYPDSLNRDVLKERSQACVLVFSKNGLATYTSLIAQDLYNQFRINVLKIPENITEIEGVIASKGIVKGRVSVVINTSQFHKVKKGDILVSFMTRPEYLPIMGLASAFVTDEGGLTSHAAIVAREMNKPCIIGTKIATKVLKDGDVVEVDANAGVIRILK